jgi:hypothetical protein
VPRRCFVTMIHTANMSDSATKISCPSIKAEQRGKVSREYPRDHELWPHSLSITHTPSPAPSKQHNPPTSQL